MSSLRSASDMSQPLSAALDEGTPPWRHVVPPGIASCPSSEASFNWWFRSVSAEVWRRAARMVRLCLPVTPAAADFLLCGEMDGQADNEPVVEDEESGLESDMA